MFDTLYQISDTSVLTLLATIFIGVSIVAVLVVKRFIPLGLRYQDNPVIGNVSALIGIIYGVLAGLTALYLINNISYIDDAVQLEASTVGLIYTDSQRLKEPARAHIKTEIEKYLKEVIWVEWPLMKIGKDVTHNGGRIISHMADEIYYYHANTGHDDLVLQSLVQEIKTLYRAREQRIHKSFSSLSAEIWIVIFIGTILTLGVNYLFGINFYLHVLTISAVALMAASMIFLLVTLDRPFQGEFMIKPDAFQEVLVLIEGDGKSPRAW